ncbi:MAG: S41 family peptidase [Prolixibacteraceae bacterium]|jgi:C-terminal processing protease CtpA/Prc
MKLKYTTAFSLVCLICLTNLNFIQAQDNLTIDQLKADFSLFKQALKEAHPGLYRYNSKDQIDSLFNQTENLIDHEMNQQEFYKLLLPVVCQIKCGHTKFHPDSNWTTNFYYNTEKVFPLRMFFQGKKAYVLGNYGNENSIPDGSEVLEINGHAIPAIIEKMLNSFCSDGNNTTFKYIEMSHYFSAYYANLFEGPDNFVVKYKNDQNVAEITVPSISYEKIELYEKQQDERLINQSPLKLDFQTNETALLTISSFWDGTNRNYEQFLENSFETIKQQKVKNLIIDLRNNEGGMDRRGALLLSYLMDREFKYYDRLEVTTRKKYSFAKQAHLPRFYGLTRHLISKEKDGSYCWNHNKNLKIQKPQKNHFSGNVYILINGASFSVTAEFAAVTHFLKRATFIGEETGGAYYGNNSGTFVIVTLPNSKLNVGIPMIAYFTAVSGNPVKDHGVMPDYKVVPTVKNIISGEDPVLESSMKLIENGNRQQTTTH